MRYAIPIIGLVILIRCAVSLLFYRNRDKVWGALTLRDGTRLEIKNRENLVGGSASADVRLKSSRRAAIEGALIRNADGDCVAYDLTGKGGVLLNGGRVNKPARVESGDTLTIGGADATFTFEAPQAIVKRPERKCAHSGLINMLLLSAFVILLFFSFAKNAEMGELTPHIAGFGGLFLLMWAAYIINRALKCRAFELEALAFMLSAVGFAVVLSSDPGDIYKELICLAAGVALYFIMRVFLRDLGRVRVLRLPIAATGLLLLIFGLLTAESILGAKNWIRIAGVSFQPSELVKIAFIFAGAAPLYSLFSKRNLIFFIGFSAICVGALVLMSDFGTALVFFTAYLVIAFMRSGSFATVFLSASGAGLAAFIAVTAKPYIGSRFASWGRAWELYNEGGYQQARTMTAVASGGFFGLGAGKGWFRSIFAADTDMVFGLVGEELGLIVAFTAVFVIILFAVFAVRGVSGARSSFYAIAACGAAAIMMAQVSLNVFGSVDLLPFTGVTFPFLSKGGTSLIASWGLLSFIGAEDARDGADLRLSERREREGERNEKA